MYFGLYSRLIAVSGVTDLVGTADASRIFPDDLPTNPTYPAITIQQIGGPRVSAMAADTGDVNARAEVKSWAKTYDGARALAKQVRLALNRWDGTAGSVVFDHIFLDNELDERAAEALFDGKRGARAVMQDYLVHHAEA